MATMQRSIKQALGNIFTVLSCQWEIKDISQSKSIENGLRLASS